MMKLFRHKKRQECDHNYKEIGRWYFEEGYANQDCIHACIVYECEVCGKQYNDWVYEQTFSDYNTVDNVKNAVKVLKNNGFVSKAEFIVNQLQNKQRGE